MAKKPTPPSAGSRLKAAVDAMRASGINATIGQKPAKASAPPKRDASGRFKGRSGR